MSYTLECSIPADHPALAGHFPGNPVVPGVVILEEVVLAVGAWRGDCRVAGVPLAKFIAPLQPERTFAIKLSGDERRVRFECVQQGEMFARGELSVKIAGVVQSPILSIF